MLTLRKVSADYSRVGGNGDYKKKVEGGFEGEVSPHQKTKVFKDEYRRLVDFACLMTISV